MSALRAASSKARSKIQRRAPSQITPMISPPQPPGAGELTGHKLISNLKYNAVVVLTTLFGNPFWFFEQRSARPSPHAQNERSET